MNAVFFFIELILIVGGVIMLTLSLLPVRGIILQLPNSPLRARWKILAGLISIFIIGYVFDLLQYLDHGPDGKNVSHLTVPGIFFFGALFVYMVCHLSLKTTIDLRRICVLEQETITDPLTGLYNRRYLERRIVEEFQCAMRFEQPFSVFLLDIDHFKNINDAYGHQIGDTVLQKLGHLMMNSVREVDVVIRYGGEEILVILPNTTEQNAMEMADRLRRQVENTIMVPTDGREGFPDIYITISIGVSEYHFSDGWDSARTVIERADNAMYRAKQQGRNRVVSSRRSDEQC